MTDITGSAADSAALQHGDRVDVHGNGYIYCSGYVEDTLPQFNVVWVRDLRTGERRMLFTNECRIIRNVT
ncbi:hypothetical protein LVY72_14245 [Arthrobacter sp. I2-34]|uniref:Uncharacterized protein n=1 Tax=Arthrobacter hankyongi TaxID=2904801 RepID=A0ABS9L8U6_9MICC|nr:hypothetical protein [Arthrobacter hankyongi]MCG2623060.1 hypothetical protein [Arthrobacter hankyongi]